MPEKTRFSIFFVLYTSFLSQYQMLLFSEVVLFFVVFFQRITVLLHTKIQLHTLLQSCILHVRDEKNSIIFDTYINGVRAKIFIREVTHAEARYTKKFVVVFVFFSLWNMQTMFFL